MLTLVVECNARCNGEALKTVKQCSACKRPATPWFARCLPRPLLPPRLEVRARRARVMMVAFLATTLGSLFNKKDKSNARHTVNAP